MLAAIVILSLNVFLAILFMPVKFGMKAHFSLSRGQALISLSVLGVSPVRIKLITDGGKFRVSVNGKKLLKRRSGGKNVSAVISFLRRERLLSLKYAFGVIGGEDAMDAAINLGAIKLFLENVLFILRVNEDGKSVFMPDFVSERLDVELNAGLKLNAVQAVRLALLLNSDR